MKRLEMGFITHDAGTEQDGVIQKRALIVYEGDFDSAEGPVTISPEHITLIATVHNARQAHLASQYTAEQVVNISPPIQLDHSTKAADTIGRLTGDLEVGDYQGKTALYGNLRILGRDNVEKVKDGRWSHLSIGADLDVGTLLEVSVVSFPAAPDARMLAALQAKNNAAKLASENNQGDTDMAKLAHEKMMNAHHLAMKKHLTHCSAYMSKLEEHTKEGEDKGIEEHVKDLCGMHTQMCKMEGSMGDAHEELKTHHTEMAKMSHLKKHLMSAMGMSDDQAEEHMSKISPEESERILSAMPEDEKNLPEEKKENENNGPEQARMSAFKNKFTELAGGYSGQAAIVRLEAKKARILVKLGSLKADGKITPAEVKKIDVAKLAASNDLTVDAVFKTYQDREPVIMAGVYGTRKAEDIASLTKKREVAKLEAETLSNMPFLAQSMGKKTVLSSEGVDPEKKPATLDETATQDSEGHHDKLAGLYAEGKHDEAREYLKQLMGKKSMDAEGETAMPMKHQMESMETAMASLQSKFDELTQLVKTEL